MQRLGPSLQASALGEEAQCGTPQYCRWLSFTDLVHSKSQLRVRGQISELFLRSAQSTRGHTEVHNHTQEPYVGMYCLFSSLVGGAEEGEVDGLPGLRPPWG